MKEVLRLVISLTVVCVISAFALAWVYDTTKEPIAYQVRMEKLRAIKAVLPVYDNEPDQDEMRFPLPMFKGKESELTVYTAKREGHTVGYAFETLSKEGYGGKILLMVGVNTEFHITGIEILSHMETPGLGSKIRQQKFRQQFVDKSLDNYNFSLKKYGGDVDQITGATISSRAFTNAAKQGLKNIEAGFSSEFVEQENE